MRGEKMNEFRDDNTQGYSAADLANLNAEWAAIVAADALEPETDAYHEALDRFQTEVARRV